ncbi:hypothetical protein D3C85_1148760 [compost metagenome]
MRTEVRLTEQKVVRSTPEDEGFLLLRLGPVGVEIALVPIMGRAVIEELPKAAGRDARPNRELLMIALDGNAAVDARRTDRLAVPWDDLHATIPMAGMLNVWTGFGRGR